MENSVPEEVSKKWERYIVFVGNLSFSSTKEEVEEYFEKCEGLTGFRLLTKPQGGSKGCGFLEFDNISSQQKALKFHHTTFKGRRINVEETCGGGGNSDSRKEKIKLKNRKRTEKSKKQKTKSEETKNEKEKSGDEKLSELPVTDVEDINQSSRGSKSKKRKLNRSDDGSDDKAAQTVSAENGEASSKKKKKKKHKQKGIENPEEEAKIPRIIPSVLESEELQEDKTEKKRNRERSHDEAEALIVEMGISEETSSKKKKKKKHKHKEMNIDNTEEGMEIPRLEPSDLDSERLQEGKKKNKPSRENGESENSKEVATNSSDLGMSNVDDSIGDLMASKKKKKKKH